MSHRLPTLYGVIGILASLAPLGCHGNRNALDAPIAAGASPSPLTIRVRDHSFEDGELAAAGLGRLEVGFRSSERPTQALPEAFVQVKRGSFSRAARAGAPLGTTTLDSLPVGDYEVALRRIGYHTLTIRVPIQPGCRTDLEAYLRVAMIGLSEVSEVPEDTGHAIATVCTASGK